MEGGSVSNEVGQEVLEPDGYLAPRRYKIHAVCTLCATKYSWITTKLDGKDKPCPNKACQQGQFNLAVERAAQNMMRMLEEQKPPGHIGGNPRIQAVDKTAEIVMQDHGMTDLKDNIRTGDAMAPKLPGPMQSMADNYFGGNAMKSRGIPASRMNALGARAMRGAMRGMAINPGQVMGGQTGEAALRSIGKESLRDAK